MMGTGWGAGMGWMWILWPLVIIATVAVAALLVRSSGRTRPPGPADHPPAHEGHGPTAVADGSTARRILDERYARGEIDEEDYRARRRRLEEPDA